MMRASFLHRSPFLLLAFALVALAVLIAPGAQPAQAQQTTTVWSATLTVEDILLGQIIGCQDGEGGNVDCSSALTSNSFRHAGTTYRVKQVHINTSRNSNPELFFGLDQIHKLDGLSLIVDGEAFPLATASVAGIRDSGDSRGWRDSGLSWAVGDTVSLSLTETGPAPGPDGTTEYWSDTLAVKAVDYGLGCGYRRGQPQCDAALTDDDLTYHGVGYTVELVHVAYGSTLQLILDREPRDRDGSTTERSRMALNVGEGELLRQFLVKDATVSGGIADDLDGDGVNEWTNEAAWVLTWTGTGLTWSEGVPVSLKLVTLPVGGL